MTPNGYGASFRNGKNLLKLIVVMVEHPWLTILKMAESCTFSRTIVWHVNDMSTEV